MPLYACVHSLTLPLVENALKNLAGSPGKMLVPEELKAQSTVKCT